MKILISVLIIHLVTSQIQIPSDDGLNLFNNMMRYLFDNCEPDLRNMGLWGNDTTILADSGADLVLSNSNHNRDKTANRKIKFFVRILDGYDQFRINLPFYEQYYKNITIEIETLLVFDKSGYNFANFGAEWSWFNEMFKSSKVYYCFELNGKITLLTVNTFANFASPIWTKIRNIRYLNSIWRVFKIKYHKETKFNYNGTELCRNIFFDRTEKLDGFTILAKAELDNNYTEYYTSNQLITKVTNISRVTSMHPLDRLFAKSLADYLDVKVKITNSLLFYPNSHPDQLLEKGFIDLSLTPKMYKPDDPITKEYYIPYPLYFFYDVIVTHNRERISLLDKIFVFNIWSIIFATLIFLHITLIVIYLANRTKFFFAVFECLRLLINNPIYKQINFSAIRIFFSVIFMYFLIIKLTFSGHLVAFWSEPQNGKNPETLEDLKDPSYTKIYAHQDNIYDVQHTELFDKTILGEFSVEECAADSSIACIIEEQIGNQLETGYNFHRIKKPVRFKFLSPLMFHNSALRYKVNNLILRLAQSGISDLWLRNHRKSITEKFKKIKGFAEDYLRPVEMKDFTFALTLLAVGLLFASICFAVEHSIKIFTEKKWRNHSDV